ncbi:unnamed protein product, partial [Closterium sp. NIES-54]
MLPAHTSDVDGTFMQPQSTSEGARRHGDFTLLRWFFHLHSTQPSSAVPSSRNQQTQQSRSNDCVMASDGRSEAPPISPSSASPVDAVATEKRTGLDFLTGLSIQPKSTVAPGSAEPAGVEVPLTADAPPYPFTPIDDEDVWELSSPAPSPRLSFVAASSPVRSPTVILSPRTIAASKPPRLPFLPTRFPGSKKYKQPTLPFRRQSTTTAPTPDVVDNDTTRATPPLDDGPFFQTVEELQLKAKEQ